MFELENSQMTSFFSCYQYLNYSKTFIIAGLNI